MGWGKVKGGGMKIRQNWSVKGKKELQIVAFARFMQNKERQFFLKKRKYFSHKNNLMLSMPSIHRKTTLTPGL